MTEKLENKEIKIYNEVNADKSVAVYGSLKNQGTMTFSDDPDLIQNEYYSQGYDASLIANNAQTKGDYASPLYVMSRELTYLQQVGIKRYLASVNYQQGAIVVNIEAGEPILYYSLVDNNLGNELTDKSYWKVLTTGGSGGTGLPLGSIFSSTVELQNPNYHLANGAELTKDGDYANFYNYMLNIFNNNKTTNTNIVSNVLLQGNLKVDNGILSGFSDNDYATFPQYFNPDNKPWKVVEKVNLSTLGTNSDIIGNNSGKDYGGLVCRFATSNKLALYLSSNGTSWNIANQTFGSYVFSAGTWYYIKIEFNGTQYIVSYSLDGEEWTADITVNNATPIYQGLFELSIGRNSYRTDYFFRGTIDLNESYSEIDGQEWWKGTSQLTTTTSAGFSTIDEYNYNISNYGSTGKYAIYDTYYKFKDNVENTEVYSNTLNDGTVEIYEKQGENFSKATITVPFNWSNQAFTNNNSFNYSVYNANLGNNTYTLFNNAAGSVKVGNYNVEGGIYIDFRVIDEAKGRLCVNSYVICSDNNSNPEYPQDWTFQGSDDESSWDILDTRTDEVFKLNEARTFSFENTKTYKYYRFNMTRGIIASNSGELSYIQLRGIEYINLDTAELKNNILQFTDNIQTTPLTNMMLVDSEEISTLDYVKLPNIKGYIYANTNVESMGDLHNDLGTLRNIDFSSGFKISNGYTAVNDGWMYIRTYGKRTAVISVNGVKVYDSTWTADNGNADTTWLPVKKGDVITGNAEHATLYNTLDNITAEYLYYIVVATNIEETQEEINVIVSNIQKETEQFISDTKTFIDETNVKLNNYINYLFPDYNSGIDQTSLAGTEIEAIQDGWVYIQGNHTSGTTNPNVVINDTATFYFQNNSTSNANSCIFLPIKKGNTYKTSGTIVKITFFPIINN